MAQKKSLRVFFLILILAALTGLILFFAVRGTKQAPSKNSGVLRRTKCVKASYHCKNKDTELPKQFGIFSFTGKSLRHPAPNGALPAGSFPDTVVHREQIRPQGE